MILNRLLLSASEQIVGCSDDPYESLTEEVSHHDASEAFLHVYYVMVFVACIWFVGTGVTKLGMPALVGEMLFGMLMGPNYLNFVGTHGSEFLIVIGEIGLIMLVVEAGIDVDIGMLKLIGPRGLAIAILGSIIPLAMGLLISLLIFQQSFIASLAIGACFAPTSMGIALNVLKKAKILNTPTGQLIIAAAILDDVIALIILSELSAMKDPTAEAILLPLIVSPVLILGIGYLAITWIPKLIQHIMSIIPERHHENGILALLFVSCFILIPACNFAGSSYLLGAFLSGLMFCTDHTIHHVWQRQVKRVLYWMLRIFFACTIGFAIPIKEFASLRVIGSGLLYCVCILGKLVTGVFARPLNKKEFLIVGFSMAARGEFSSILATASYLEGTISKESYSAILLSIVFTAILSPYALTFTIKYYDKRAQKQMEANQAKYQDEFLHPVYLVINTKARGQWGHQDKILYEIHELALEIIDFRSWHAPEYNHSHHRPLTKESFYVMDKELLLAPTAHLSLVEKEKLKSKVKLIRSALKLVLGEKSVVSCKRWLPGVMSHDDAMEVHDDSDQAQAQLQRKLSTRRTSYCRREAFKQAHAIMSMSSMDLTQILEEQVEEPEPVKPVKLVQAAIAAKKEPDYKEWLNTFGQSVPATTKPISQTQSANTKPRKIRLAAPLTRTQSDGTGTQQPFMASMSRQTSAIDYHSGMGHGGKAHGVGALPVVNNFINIHDFFEERKTFYKHNSLTDNEYDSDASVSVIYGDENAQHHKLPEYQSTFDAVAQTRERIQSQSPGPPPEPFDYYRARDSTIVENLDGIKKLRKMTYSNPSVATGSFPGTPSVGDVNIAIEVSNISVPSPRSAFTITPLPVSPTPVFPPVSPPVSPPHNFKE